MRLPRPPSALVPVAAMIFALGVGACTHKIGDTCTTNVNCSALGDRFCDLSKPCGYCTVESCDVRLDNSVPPVFVDSCPSESACIRYFTPIASKAGCDVKLLSPQNGCALNERCLCDCGFVDPKNPVECNGPTSLTVNEIDGGVRSIQLCGGGSHCASESTERRWCQLTCNHDNGNGDCRVDLGYTCQFIGVNGSSLVPRQIVLPDGGTVAMPVPTDPTDPTGQNLPKSICMCTDPVLCQPVCIGGTQ